MISSNALSCRDRKNSMSFWPWSRLPGTREGANMRTFFRWRETRGSSKPNHSSFPED